MGDLMTLLPKEGPDSWAYEICLWYQGFEISRRKAKTALKWLQSKRANKLFSLYEIEDISKKLTGYIDQES